MIKKYFILLFIMTSIVLALRTDATGQQSTHERLWQLGKITGFAKYYHPNNCQADWNALTLDAIELTLNTTSDSTFNFILVEFLESLGSIPHATDPLEINSELNLNANFEWINTLEIESGVKKVLDSIRLNFRPRENCLVKYNSGANPNYFGYLSFENDNILNIPGFTYSKASHRLLSLFYYWNIVNYYFPDRFLMDQDWDSTLMQFIPTMIEAEGETQFHLSFLELVTYINDTHGFTSSPIIDNFFGTKYPLIKIQYAENNSVVTKVAPDNSEIAVGDIVRKIDGIEIAFLMDSFRRHLPVSNNNTFQRDFHTKVIMGDLGSVMNLELEDSTGAIYTTTINRNFSSSTYYNWAGVDLKPVWEITDCGYGYVNMGKLTTSFLPLMYNELKNTPAIIFDVRNYPVGTINPLISYLFSGPISYALFADPDLTYPGRFNWVNNKPQTGEFTNPNPYSGKVIILVNAESQSHSEYTIMGLQQHPNAFTIGSQTAGADGNVSNMYLPGNLLTYWTSLGVYYPDTTNAQRVGVKIDSIVTPTIADIRKGRDTELLAAFDCLTSSNHKIETPGSLHVFPNPASDFVYLTYNNNYDEETSIQVTNLLGQIVMSKKLKNDSSKSFPIDISHFPIGTYIVSCFNERGTLTNLKLLVVK